MNDSDTRMAVGMRHPRTLVDIEELCRRARLLGMTDGASVEFIGSDFGFIDYPGDLLP